MSFLSHCQHLQQDVPDVGPTRTPKGWSLWTAAPSLTPEGKRKKRKGDYDEASLISSTRCGSVTRHHFHYTDRRLHVIPRFDEKPNIQGGWAAERIAEGVSAGGVCMGFHPGKNLRWRCLVLIVIGVCCTDRPNPPISGFVERDSAGVSIVEVSSTGEIGGRVWTVSSQPLVTISTDPFDSEHVVHRIRGAVRLTDGRIASISESEKELRLYSPSGNLESVVGGPGDGPGEFRAPFELIRRPGDTLVVTERGSNRRSWFSPEGEFVRRTLPDRLRVQPRIPEGFILEFGYFVPPDLNLWEVEEGGFGPVGQRFRKPRGYLLADAFGTHARMLGWFGGWEHFYLEKGLGGLAFFPETSVATVGGAPPMILIGDSEEINLRIFDLEGRMRRIIRDERPGRPIEKADIEWERWALLSLQENHGDLQEWNRLANAMPMPESRPAFEDLNVDSEGFVWLKEYSGPRPGPVRYRIYSPEGRPVAWVELPGRLHVTDIGSGFVLGIYIDLNGEESIRLYSLSRSF